MKGNLGNFNHKPWRKMEKPLLVFDDKGIFCAIADVYLDPWKSVNKAIISHGHADHSRWGHKKYITHHSNIPIIKYRLGDIEVSGKEWNFYYKWGEVFHSSGRPYYGIFPDSGGI